MDGMGRLFQELSHLPIQPSVQDFDQIKVFRSWFQLENFTPFNVLEIRATTYALVQFDLPVQSVVLVSSHNSIVIVYVTKHGENFPPVITPVNHWSLRTS